MKTSDIVATLESCIIAFEEGASDEKRMALSMLEGMKEKLEKELSALLSSESDLS